MQQLRMIISGGGTGGHIFPAIAIANAVKKLVPNAEILFVGAKDKMEMEKVPSAGYPIQGLWISGFQRRLTLSNLLFPVKVIVSLFKARSILKKFRPDVVVGTGGFASGPVLRMAALMNLPTIIQEQNSYAGITNKVLGKKVDRICVAYEGMEKFFPREKVILTGNPVRSDIHQLEGKAARGFEHFNLSTEKPVLLIIGGSLGARTINHSIRNGLDQLKAAGVQLIWQTGKSFFPEAQSAIEQAGYPDAHAFDFIQRMDYAYAVATLVVSRAGASSVSELSIVRKPCILIPSPNVAEDHQTKNAMALSNHNAAILVKDIDAPASLVSTVVGLIKDENELEKLAVNISKLALHDSAEVIANEVIRLAGSRK